MRELWGTREKDHVFHDLSPDCRPMPLPFMFGATGDQNPTGESGISPLPGSPEELRRIATSLCSLGKAYHSGRSSDLPKMLEMQVQQQKGSSEDSSTTKSDHAQPLNWPGWGQHSFGLELQAPWAAKVIGWCTLVGEYGQNKSETLDSAGVRHMRSLFQIQQTEVDSSKKRKGKRDNINSQDKKHKKKRY
jgi:hypothetical protein